MIDLHLMASQLSQRSKHRQEDWYSVLNAAIHDPALTQMTDGEIYLLVGAMRSPDQMNWVLDIFRDSYMKMTSEMPFDFVIRHVNQTPHSLRDWLEALQVAHQHNVQRKNPAELEKLVQLVAQVCPHSAQDLNASGLVDAVKNKLVELG